MRILFISHSFPPVVGGVENQNYNLSRGLSKTTQVKVIANGRGKKWLPVFLPVAFLEALFLMTRFDACLLGSGVLAPLGAALRFFHPRREFFCVVHGLDITYGHKTGLLPIIYRKVNIPSLRRLDKLIAVGQATLQEALKVGVAEDKCVFVPNGVTVEDLKEEHSREELSELLGEGLEGKRVILRLARFVPHKGTSWFIENIMPRLPENVVLIAAGNRVARNAVGDRDDFPNCEKATVDRHLESRVKLLPSLPWKDVKILLNTVDLVVSPNIRIPGSIEGFGINVIEAGACGRVVIASNLEGLADAIKDGENGFLVESGNVDEWVRRIDAVLGAAEGFLVDFGKRASQYVVENYSWDEICRRYLEAMEAARSIEFCFWHDERRQ